MSKEIEIYEPPPVQFEGALPPYRGGAASRAPSPVAISERQRRLNAQLGMSDEQYLANLRKGARMQPPPSTPHAPVPRASRAAAPVITERQRKINAQLGMSDEQYLANLAKGARLQNGGR